MAPGEINQPFLSGATINSEWCLQPGDIPALVVRFPTRCYLLASWIVCSTLFTSNPDWVDKAIWYNQTNISPAPNWIHPSRILLLVLLTSKIKSWKEKHSENCLQKSNFFIKIDFLKQRAWVCNTEILLWTNIIWQVTMCLFFCLFVLTSEYWCRSERETATNVIWNIPFDSWSTT